MNESICLHKPEASQRRHGWKVSVGVFRDYISVDNTYILDSCFERPWKSEEASAQQRAEGSISTKQGVVILLPTGMEKPRKYDDT